MLELIGKECEVVFTLPHWHWPFGSTHGPSVTVVIDAVDMPMVKLREFWSGDTIWVNASIIQSIRKRHQ